MRTKLHRRPRGLKYPFGVQNPDSAEALQFFDDPRIILTRFIQVVTDKESTHIGCTNNFLPYRAVVRTQSTGVLPQLSFGLTGRPKVGKLAVSSYESVPPIRIW